MTNTAFAPPMTDLLSKSCGWYSAVVAVASSYTTNERLNYDP